MPLWKFIAQYTDRQVGYRYTETPMPDGAMRFNGTPAEALDIAQSIGKEGDHNWIAAVCEDELIDEPEWMLFRVVERNDKKGWNLEVSAVTGMGWYRERNSAVNYAVSRSKGHVVGARKEGKPSTVHLIQNIGSRKHRRMTIPRGPNGMRGILTPRLFLLSLINRQGGSKRTITLAKKHNHLIGYQRRFVTETESSVIDAMLANKSGWNA
jgi:hypothetical protein